MLAVRGEQALQREDEATRCQTVPRSTRSRPGFKSDSRRRPENVAVVRHALAGLAEQIGMDETGVADLKTVVTEACMNVAVHAYPKGARARLRPWPSPTPKGLTVTVRDSGAGSDRGPSSEQSQPPPRALADRRPLQQLLLLGRPQPGHGDRGCASRCRGGGAVSAARRAQVFSSCPPSTPRSRGSAALSSWLRCLRGSSAPSPPAATSRSIASLTPSLLTDAIAEEAPVHFADRRVRLGAGRRRRRCRVAPGSDGERRRRGDPRSPHGP